MKNRRNVRYGEGVFNLLNKNIKDFNKIILSLGCASFIFLMGLLSYKISNSYAYFTNSVTGSKTIEMTYTKPSLDKSGANAPLLSSNMIPVYYDEASSAWKKADTTNTSKNYKWYDYSNKMWANAVTVTSANRSTYLNASVGTTIPMSDINTMWVWIPRYTYTYFSTNTPEEIKIKFESGTSSSGTITCTDTVTGTSSTSETCTDSVNGSLIAGTSTYTHPAFWWDKDDDNVRDKDEEFIGIWVGKFEVSSNCVTGDSNIAVGAGCNIETIRPQIIPGAIPWTSAMVGTFFNDLYNMRESGNQYGFSKADETHMMKNMEWGAVTYLTHSKYGRCTNGNCTEVSLNSYYNYSNMLTGCGPESNESTSSTEICNDYDTELGKLASTTGSVFGIYDMSGGSWEYMMSDMVYQDGTMMSGDRLKNYEYSGFTGYLNYGGNITGEYAFPNKRYYDKYSYGTSSTEFSRGKLGEATKEMKPSSSDQTSWYNDRGAFPYFDSPWITRGSVCLDDSGGGLFEFLAEKGHAKAFISSRAVISNLN